MPRALPSIPLRLLFTHYEYPKPWIMQRVKGNVRFFPPDIEQHKDATVDAADYLKLLMDIRNAEDAHQFVNRYGAPCEVGHDGARYVSLREIRDLQSHLKVFAKSPTEALLSRLHGLWMVFRFETGNLTAVCNEVNPAMTCFAQLFFEKQAGTEFGWCERHDCGRFFRCKSKHKRKYCSPECAHLVAVRKSRVKKGG
jgi:hypothetical protein